MSTQEVGAQDDVWTTVTTHTSRRRRPRRGGGGSIEDTNKSNFIQIVSTETSQPASMEKFEELLILCQEQLLQTDFWKAFRTAVESTGLNEIVCYGIGNFYTKRQSAPLWQLALALLIQNQGTIIGSEDDVCVERGEDGTSQATKSTNGTPMYYFDPKMTEEERLVLQQYHVAIIAENERACRCISFCRHNMTLFFMPHCGVSLYTNLLYTNWDDLDSLTIFGNSLEGYLEQCGDHDRSPTVSTQSHGILKTLQPYWTETPLRTSLKDNALHHMENAFNNSGIISFKCAQNDKEAQSFERIWPDRPIDYNTNKIDTSGEVL
jgi:hypothetical protein